MKKQKIIKVMCLCMTVVAFSCASTKFSEKKKYVFSQKQDILPDVWVVSNTHIIIKADSFVVNNGEYRINDQSWSSIKNHLKKGDKLQLRVRSSKYPNDVTMTQLLLGKDTILFQAKTTNFQVPAKTGNVRNINLGISGPSSDAIGGISPKGLLYNSDTAKMGSAVKKGLIPPLKPLFNAQIRDAVICVGGDNRYYLTGSSGNDIWHFNDGVELWVSDDLKKWDYLGLVWSFEKDAT